MTTAELPARGYQTYLHNEVAKARRAGHRRILIQSGTGTGKCLGRGTPVLMHDGRIKPVEAVLPGDLLMGPDSRPRRVLSICSGREMLYRVTPVKGDPYVVNESHILSLKRTGTHEIVNLGVRDWLAATAKFRHCHKGWRTGVDFDPVDPLPAILPAYLLGLWLGDGTSTRPELTNIEPEVADYVVAYGEAIGLPAKVVDPIDRCRRITLTGRRGDPNPLLDALRSFGLIGNKHIPRAYLTASRIDRLHLLAGLIDTDGSLSCGGFEISTKRDRLRDDVLFLARSLGFAAYSRTGEKTCSNNGATGTYHRIFISGDIGLVPCRVARKQAAPRRQAKSVLVTGITVEPIGEGDYFGFEIDGDRLFLLGDFTVTHNTFMSSRFHPVAERAGLPSVFLTPRRELAYQTITRIASFGIEPGLIMAGEPYNPKRLTQVASVDTLLARAVRRDLIKLPRARLLNVDECHLFITEARMGLIEAIAGDDGTILGWTATPARGDGRPLKAQFDHLILGPSNAWMMEQGYLVKPRYFAPSQPDIKLLKVGKDGDYTEKSARAAAMLLVGDVVDNWKRLAEGRSTVVFAVDCKHGLALCEEFQRAGVTAEFVDQNTDKQARRAIFDRVRSGATTVLVNVFIAGYGLDIPRLSVCVLARPTKSLVFYHQAGGRVLRPVYNPELSYAELESSAELRLFGIASSDKPDCIIIDHAGAIDRLGLLEDDIPWTLEGDEDIADVVMRKKRERGEPKEITCPVCKAVFKGRKFCPKCGYELVTRGEPIPVHKADLVEVVTGNAANRKTSWPEKVEFMSQALGYARRHGKKMGFAAHLYRERFGVWPNDARVRDASPKEPGQLVVGFVKHIAIKKKHSHAKAG